MYMYVHVSDDNQVQGHRGSMKLYRHAVTFMYICWKLLSNQNFKGPYLVNRGDHGMARVSRPATSNKIVT